MSTAPNHRNPQHQPSTSKPPKSSTAAATVSQNPSPNPSTSKTPPPPPPPITLSQENPVLSRVTHLTRPELLRRRSHYLKQLSKCYKDHYWGLVEELKTQYRDYYWEFGVSPVKDSQQEDKATERESVDNNNNNNKLLVVEGSGDNVTSYNNGGGFLDIKNNQRCSFIGCKLKAMAFTSFCHLHILSDSKQKLYKPCDYVIKSGCKAYTMNLIRAERTVMYAGPITCGKPILRSTVPSLCNVHFQKAQKHVTRALKKAGHNVSSSSKLAPKFHVIVSEYVREIQAKRRNELKKNRNKVVVKEESAT
ncbi:hypothetical protein EZV62_001451 [Acer yangbiense]|uniref:KAT8 regulatory NSL complex subunit 2 n=1 Tax=Acer yangbiense TaxID=1000413 RepID=A0A5C7IWI9_9ROSI|nr:hypothetical protein EZV62_001451 [Acer yangbiense]